MAKFVPRIGRKGIHVTLELVGKLIGHAKTSEKASPMVTPHVRVQE